MQLVTDDIRLYDPMKSKVLGEKEVVEKWKKDVEQAGFDYSNEIIASEKGFSIFRVLPRS